MGTSSNNPGEKESRVKKYQLALVIPVYNEEACIQEVLQSWNEVLEKEVSGEFCLLVYDDGSTDASYQEIVELSKEIPAILPFQHKNMGHGPTLLKGYSTGFTKADWVLQIDSDNEINPEDFPSFWESRDTVDFVIGKRNRDSPWIREIITGFSRSVIHLLCGNTIYDTNCPFRLLRSEVFKRELAKIPANTFAPNLLISGIASKRKLRIQEVAITHKFRETGHVSIQKFKLLRVSIQSFIQTLRFFLLK